MEIFSGYQSRDEGRVDFARQTLHLGAERFAKKMRLKPDVEHSPWQILAWIGRENARFWRALVVRVPDARPRIAVKLREAQLAGAPRSDTQ